MKYFLDTEFHEYKKKPLFSKGINTIELISIGIVAENRREYYAISKEFDVKAAWKNEWLRENVLKLIHAELLSQTKQYEFWGNIGQGKEAANRYVAWAYNKQYSNLCNELHSLIQQYGKTNKEIAEEIQVFTGREVIEDKFGNGHWYWEEKPEFYAYYADYDWVVFCWLFGRMIDLPKEFPMYCIDLKQELDRIQKNTQNVQRKAWPVEGNIEDHFLIKNDPNYPKNSNAHNALADAKWNRDLFVFLKSL